MVFSSPRQGNEGMFLKYFQNSLKVLIQFIGPPGYSNRAIGENRGDCMRLGAYQQARWGYKGRTQEWKESMLGEDRTGLLNIPPLAPCFYPIRLRGGQKGVTHGSTQELFLDLHSGSTLEGPRRLRFELGLVTRQVVLLLCLHPKAFYVALII